MQQKVLIVGGGIAGLSAAWALAKRGVAVELFEQGSLPNPRASSYDEHRITRHAYGRMEGYAHLMPEAFRIWDQLWQAIGTSHYDPCGAVYFLRDDTGWYNVVSRSLTAMDIGYRDIPLDDIPRRFPMVNPAGLWRVVETDQAGMLFPMRILTDMVVLLARLGVTLHANVQVSDVDPGRGTLIADGVTHSADTVIVAAGAWADRLVPSLRDAVVPSRQAVLYLAPPPALAQAWADAPVMLDVGAKGGTYTLPPHRGTRLKIGDHVFSRTGDPDEDRFATDRDLERLWPAAAATYRDFASYTVLERKACFYTVNDHEEFQVRPIGPAGWVISACSGHGFKLGSLMGELVTRAITGEMPAAEVPDLAAGRVIDPPWR
ncbi:FAD-binding oxidoreductase [Acidisphaera sp. L21]|uniref:NAD(P)/FAD-dependent oxidoreductase n=1 Tax=Acidisphaera sp. L21 TaxID=1641851 RepID=UPI00131E8716|nr:FAD-dependent oxidoreductase [Acidisphaera sp. L21]